MRAAFARQLAHRAVHRQPRREIRLTLLVRATRRVRRHWLDAGHAFVYLNGVPLEVYAAKPNDLSPGMHRSFRRNGEPPAATRPRADRRAAAFSDAGAPRPAASRASPAAGDPFLRNAASAAEKRRTRRDACRTVARRTRSAAASFRCRSSRTPPAMRCCESREMPL